MVDEPSGQSLVVVANPVAGRGRAGQLADRVADHARRRGADVVRGDSPSADAARRVVATAVDRGCARVVAVGGDGLVHHVAQEIAGTPVELGVVAVGTGNDVARGHGLPTRVDDAVETAITGLAAPVDAISSTSGWALSVATAGVSVAINARADRSAVPLGRSVYFLASLVEIPRMRPVVVGVDVDGRSLEVEAVMLAVGCTRWFGGGMDVCPAADPHDGMLDVTIVGSVGRVRLARLLRTIFGGDHVDQPEVRTLRGRSVTLDTGAGDLRADGEPYGQAPVRLEAVGAAISIAGANAPVRATP